MKKESAEVPTVKSAERVIDVLEKLTKNPLGLSFTDLKEKMDIPKSSLYQLLTTLESNSMIRFDSNLKKYYFGIRFWEFATTYSNQLPIAQVAEPYLKAILNEHNETVQMAVLDKRDVVYIAKMVSSRPVQLVSQVGSRLPAYVTGIGKAILACYSEQEIVNLFPEKELAAYTKNTITSRKELLEELRVTREQGYARDLGEYSSGIRCVASPVIGFNNLPVGAVSLSILEEQISEEREKHLAEGIIKCTVEMSRQFGGTEPLAWRT